MAKPDPNASAASTSTSPSQLGDAYVAFPMLLMVLYPMWSIVLHFATPAEVDDPLGRTLVAVVGVCAFVASRWRRLRPHTHWVMTLAVSVLSIHFYSVVAASGLSDVYLLGASIVTASVGLMFDRLRTFVVYALLNVALSVHVAVQFPDSSRAPILVCLVVTVHLVLFGETHVRTRAVRRLRDAQQKNLEISRTLLQNEIDSERERARELASRERAIQQILDSTGDALLSVGLDGRIWACPSRSAVEWFGRLEPGTPVWDYLSPDDERFKSTFSFIYGEIVEDVLPFEVYAEQLPRAFDREGRTYELEYRQVHEEGKFARILVVVRDVTVARKAARGEQEARERQAIIERILADRDGTQAFVCEAESILADLATQRDLVVVKRLLHTLKGNSRTTGFLALAARCHEVEDALEDDEATALPLAQAAELTSLFQSRMLGIHAYLRPGFAGGVELRQEEYESVLHAVRARRSYAELSEIMESWPWKRTCDPLRRLAEKASGIATRLGKEVNVTVADGGLRVAPEALDEFWQVLVHVVQNAIDHGIEDVAARIGAGKTGAGHLRLETRLAAQGFIVEIADDGAGVDVASLKRAAAKRSMAPDSDVVDMLFADGVSSRSEVTATSGRGVGLAAVRASCERAGGTVTVSWRAGAGTVFRFTFPPALARATDPLATPLAA